MLGPNACVFTSDLLTHHYSWLEMSWYIAIHNYYNPVSQHGIACYVTKLESQSFRLRLNFGVACSARELLAQSAVCVCGHTQSVVHPDFALHPAPLALSHCPSCMHPSFDSRQGLLFRELIIGFIPVRKLDCFYRHNLPLK